MKKFLFILMFFVSLQLLAQDITLYKQVVKTSVRQDIKGVDMLRMVLIKQENICKSCLKRWDVMK